MLCTKCNIVINSCVLFTYYLMLFLFTILDVVFVYRHMSSEQTALLLYFLLHGNQNVASFIFSRSDIDALVIPLVEQLHAHKVGEDSSHHLYMLLIIFLILSQDEVFNKTIHEIVSHQLCGCDMCTCIRTCIHAYVHVVVIPRFRCVLCGCTKCWE